MAKTYLPGSKGAVFKNVIRFSDATPLDGRVVVDSYVDIAGEAYKTLFSEDGVQTWYVGMLVVAKDTGKLYVLVEKTKVENDVTVNYAEFDEVTPDLSNIHGSITAETLEAAQALATANNIGQVIYIPTKMVDGEVANASEAGAYIVTGAGTVNKLATTTASGDLVADVTALQGDVADIKRDYAKTADVNKTLEDYAKTADVNKTLEDYAKSADLEDYATTADWKVKDVDANDKVLSLTGGVLSSSLSYTREEVNGVDSLVLKGKNNEVLGSVPVADFVVDGMLQKVEHSGNKLVFTFNTNVEDDDTPTVIEIDLADYIDAYTGDNTTVKVENNVISLVNPFTTAHAETLSTAVQPGDLAPYAKTADVNKTLEDYAKTADVNKTLEGYVATTLFNPWKESVDTKLGELEVAIGNAGKVDDVQFDGATIVDNKVANLNNILATSIDDTETKAVPLSLAKESFLMDVDAMTEDDINAIIDPISSQPIQVNISALRFSTLYSDKALSIPAGITAYTGALNDNSLSMNPIAGDVIPAATAVVLEGDAGSYSFYETRTKVDAIKDNILRGTSTGLETADVTDGIVYTLQADQTGTGVVFAQYSGDYLAAGKAYLVLSAEDGDIDVRFE